MNDQLRCPVYPYSTVVVSLTLFFNHPDYFAGGLLHKRTSASRTQHFTLV